MFDNLRDARKEFFDFFLPEGVDPLYLATALLVSFVLLEWKNFQQWEKLSKQQQGLLKALLFVTVISVVGSVLQITGAI